MPPLCEKAPQLCFGLSFLATATNFHTRVQLCFVVVVVVVVVVVLLLHLNVLQSLLSKMSRAKRICK